MSPPLDHRTSPLLTVIVPVYNEEGTIGELLRRVLAGPYAHPQKEVVVVDDGSTDGTARVLEQWRGQPGVKVLRHVANRGKGAAVRTGLATALGTVVVVQDADLEYDPDDYPLLVEPILAGDADAVYGSRYLRPESRLPWTKYRLAVYMLNALVFLLYGRRLTDEATCYKALRTALALDLRLTAERFELCAEITAKLCRQGVPILEAPIRYCPRSRAEGKKIGWRDVWPTVAALFRWRFVRLDPPGAIHPFVRPGRRDFETAPAEVSEHGPTDRRRVPVEMAGSTSYLVVAGRADGIAWVGGDATQPGNR